MSHRFATVGRSAVAALAFLFVGAVPCLAQSDVTSPGDAVVVISGLNDGDGFSGAPPAAEGAANAIDNTTNKYLNFLDLGSGLIVTPTFGLNTGGTIVTGLRLFTANDAPERDPASYTLEGATSPAGPWTLISSGALDLPTGRNVTTNPPTPIDALTQFSQTVTFSNANGYTSYRLVFPTLRNAATANSMQIGEVELLGVAVPTPTSALLLTFAGGLALRRRR
ncbi:MAG: hypothetical protein ACREJO_12230 [Phycisphaerales bacterium]